VASLQWQSKRLTVVIVLGRQQPSDDNDDVAGFVSAGSGDYTPAPQLQVLWDEEDDTPPDFGFRSTGEGQ